MAVVGTDLVIVERAGVLHKTTAGEVGALGGGGGGAAVITPVLVTFATAKPSGTFTVSVPGAITSQRVIASVSGNMPAGVSFDELEMDPLAVYGYVSAADTVVLMVNSVRGGPVLGQRNINLTLG